MFGARTGADPQVLAAAAAPGIGGSPAPARRDVALAGEAQTVVAPAGGNPAQVSSLPGLGAVVSTLLRGSQRALPDIPGQSAVFETAPFDVPFTLVGSATADVEVRTDAPDVTLFAKLLDVGPGGAEAVLPNRLVSTVRLDRGGVQTVRVVLPAVVREIQPGHSLRLVLTTTDQAYAMPVDPRTYDLSLAGSRRPLAARSSTSRRCRRTASACWWAPGSSSCCCSASASPPSPCVGAAGPSPRRSIPSSSTCRWSCTRSARSTPAASAR